MKEQSKNSGKSKSETNPFGIRRKDKTGQDLSPRSIRKKIKYLKDLTKEQKAKAGILNEKD